jgi:cbb3-type cytochrome oxidase subunit 3
MERTASTLVLGLILAAATAWLFGSAVRAVLRFLGESMRYAGDVGGLAALVAFVVLGVYVVYRVARGR